MDDLTREFLVESQEGLDRMNLVSELVLTRNQIVQAEQPESWTAVLAGGHLLLPAWPDTCCTWRSTWEQCLTAAGAGHRD